MLKLQLLVITIIFLCALATISSTSKAYVVVGNKNTHNDEVMLHLNTNQNQYEQGFQDQQDILKKKPRNKTSTYTGVSWNKRDKKWKSNLIHNQKNYYGGLFDNEEQAAMKVNLLCGKCEIERKNPTIDIKPNAMQQKPRNKTSIYTGVCWHDSKKWRAQLKHNKKNYYGGLFDNEEQAAMGVNLLCDKYEIERKNPTINIKPIPMQHEPRNKTSIYAGVSWHNDSKRWRAQLVHNKKNYHGGLFDNEEQAAMGVNLLCDKYEIERKNPTINIKPIQMQQKPRNKTSIYTGVSWNKRDKKWQAKLMHNKKNYHDGFFDNEEYAAMRVNLLCDKYEMERKNPTIDTKPNAMQQKTKSKIHQSEEEAILHKEVKVEEENIIDGFKNEYENRFMQSNDEKRCIDKSSYKNQNAKRKRKQKLNYE